VVDEDHDVCLGIQRFAQHGCPCRADVRVAYFVDHPMLNASGIKQR
jgi:hypothetical protein